MTLKTAVQPKETKEAKEFEGFMRTRPPTYRVNGGYLRTSFLSALFVSFGHPSAGLSKNRAAALSLGAILKGLLHSLGKMELVERLVQHHIDAQCSELFLRLVIQHSTDDHELRRWQ